jgi:hypothetical protein
VVAVVIAVFGVLGLIDGLAYFSTDAERIAGLSSNGPLSTISLVTAARLVVAALRSSRVASTMTLVVGVLFQVSALANLAVLETELSVLAFLMANVVFSICAGLVLLTLGGLRRGQRQPARRQPVPQRVRTAIAATRRCWSPVAPVLDHGQLGGTGGDRRDVWMSFDRAPRN